MLFLFHQSHDFMMTYAPQVGDVLTRTKGGILSEHYALFIGYHDDIPWVVENQNGFGIRYITLEQFLSEGDFKGIRRSYANADLIYQRVHELLQQRKQYDLFSYNCEHFVNEVSTGKAYSTQIQKGVVFGGIAALLLLAFRFRA